MQNNSSNRERFLNTHFDNISFDQVTSIIKDHIASRTPGYMVSLNTDIAVWLEKDEVFRQSYDKATMALIDSQPLIKLAKSAGLQVKEKLSGSDLMPRICSWAAQYGYRFYILGGMGGVTQRAAANLCENNHGLRCVGVQSPPYGFQSCKEKTDTVIQAINQAQPDILFICLGSPKSEKFLAEHLEELNVPFSLCVGAAVDFVAGNVKRAPMWMQNAGFEWLYRFLQEPKRLFKRYFVDSWKLVSIIRRYGIQGQR